MGRIFFISAIVIVCFLFVRQLYLRIVYDLKNNKVEVCIELEQLKKFCKRENYKLENLLKRIKTIGVSSLVLKEETFGSLCNSGKIMYFSLSDVKKLHLLGLLAPGAELKGEMIVVEDKRTATYIKSVIEEKTGLTIPKKKSGKYTLFEIPETLKTLGFGYLPEDMALVDKNAFSVILSPYDDFWIPQVLPDNLSCIKLTTPMCKGEHPVQHFLRNSWTPLYERGYVEEGGMGMTKLKNIKVAIEEFSDEEKSYRHLFIPIAENVLRMHRVVHRHRYSLLSKLTKRWLRAVKERNCRIVYFDFLDELNIEENLSYLRDMCNQLRNCKFELTNIGKQAPAVSGLPVWLANFVAFIVAVISPVLSVYCLPRHSTPPLRARVGYDEDDRPYEGRGLFKAKASPGEANRRVNSCGLQPAGLRAIGRPVRDFVGRISRARTTSILMKFFHVSLINIIAGLAISAILTSSVFLVKVAEFRFVKVAFILSVVLSIFVLFDMNKLKEFFLKPQSLLNTTVIFILIFTLFAAVYRIGTIERISNLELWIREFFEEMFYIRPRFKEFLIGHPLMILGLSLNNRLLLVFGLIGQISIINTFIHLHTPLSISILRTIYGIFLGSLIGLLIVVIRQTVIRFIPIRVREL